MNQHNDKYEAWILGNILVGTFSYSYIPNLYYLLIYILIILKYFDLRKTEES